MKAPQFMAVVGSFLFLTGCGGRDAASHMLTKGPPSPHARPDAAPAPDLRIPANAVASAQDIPVVRVPPVPLGRGAAPADAPRPNIAPAAPPVLPPVPAPPVPAPPVAATPVSGEATATTPTREPVAAETETNFSSLRQLQQQAAAWYAGVDSYIVRMTRREVVSGTAKPEEIMLLKFRKEPWSLHFKWIGKAGQGREVLYVKGQYDNKIHTRLAAGDMPLMPAGMKMSFEVDSPLVRSASRHPITDAGLGACIGRLGANLDAQEHGDKSRGVLNDLGTQTRPEYPVPVRAAEMAIPAGVEPELSTGGRRRYFFDPDLHLPLLIVTYDDRNQEVEYYHYDRLIAPAALDAEDFNPDRLWTNPKPAGKPQ